MLDVMEAFWNKVAFFDHGLHQSCVIASVCGKSHLSCTYWQVSSVSHSLCSEKAEPCSLSRREL